jgi:hypothetical protein
MRELTWDENTGMSNHTAMMEQAAKLTIVQCEHVIADTTEAIKAMPEGRKAGHYEDERHYASMRVQHLKGNRNALSAYCKD